MLDKRMNDLMRRHQSIIRGWFAKWLRAERARINAIDIKEPDPETENANDIRQERDMSGPSKDYCMCGSPIDHSAWDAGHEPVSEYDYALQCLRDRNQRYISSQQFDELQRAIQRMEALGYGPEACVLEACKQIGIDPPGLFEPVEIVVVNQQSTEKP